MNASMTSKKFRSLRTFYFVFRYVLACAVMSSYPVLAHADSVNANSIFSFYSQCAASVNGAQGSTLQDAYSLSAGVKQSLKSCMRLARDTQDLAVHQAIQACLQSGGTSISNSAVMSSSSVSTTSASSNTAVDLFRACRKQVGIQLANSLSASASSTPMSSGTTSSSPAVSIPVAQ